MDVLIGFTTILIVIGCGAALAHVGVLDARSQRTLGEIAFLVALPADRAEHLPARHALSDRGGCCPRDHPRDDALSLPVALLIAVLLG